ncbi:MAG: hypothetical protein ACK53L_11525, partial [Pirellulaceae bacterium]
MAAALAFQYVNTDSSAEVLGNTTLRGSNVRIDAVTADGDMDLVINEFIAWAASAAGGRGDFAFIGSAAINVVDMVFKATTSPDSHVKAINNLTVQAENDMNPQTLAAGAGFAGQSGSDVVGGSLSYVNVDLETRALLLGDADAGASLSVLAETTISEVTTVVPEVNISIPFSTVAVSGSASGGDTGVAGALAINDFLVSTHAKIGASSEINQAADITDLSTQTVRVEADDTTSLTSMTGALGIA